MTAHGGPTAPKLSCKRHTLVQTLCSVGVRHHYHLLLQVIPGTSSAADTPFAAAAQRAPSRAAFDSDLGFPTDFGERYRLTEEIGSGSFGTVYAAEDKESGEVVAVKVMLGYYSVQTVT